LRFCNANDVGQNALAVRVADGALRNPIDFGYGHMAYPLRLHTIDEPGSMPMAPNSLAAAVTCLRRCGPARAHGEAHRAAACPTSRGVPPAKKNSLETEISKLLI